MTGVSRPALAFAILLAALFVGCGRAPEPVARDPAAEAWYLELTAQLAALSRDAEQAYKSGNADRASALIQQGEPVAKRLVSVARPSMAALEAASDLDDLYGRMLLANRHYGWARLQFQKNAARWKAWTPQTPETARRLKQALDAIAECDQHL